MYCTYISSDLYRPEFVLCCHLSFSRVLGKGSGFGEVIFFGTTSCSIKMSAVLSRGLCRWGIAHTVTFASVCVLIECLLGQAVVKGH